MENEETQAQPSQSRKGLRGFASMSPERRRQIASMGGTVAHARGTAHQFTSEEARAAGKKGGHAVQALRTARNRIQEKIMKAGLPDAAAEEKIPDVSTESNVDSGIQAC